MDIDLNKIRRLDFSLLTIFDGLVRYGRTTIVAERLGLSQSAVSHALARLRDLFDDPLFLRRPDGLTPTRRALDLAPAVRDVLARTQSMLDGPTVFDPWRSRRCFRLAANDLVATLFGPRLLDLLASEAPEARLTSRFAVGPAALRALRQDEVDLAVGRFHDMPDDFVAETILREDFTVVLRAGHPALARRFDLAIYLALDHLLVSFSGKLYGMVDDALAAQGQARRVRASVPMFLTAFAAVSESDLVATVPSRLARRFSPAFGLATRRPPLVIPDFPIDIVRHETSGSDGGLAWLAGRIRQISQELH